LEIKKNLKKKKNTKTWCQLNEDISIEPGENKAFIKVKCRFSYVSSFEMFAHPMPVFAVDIHP
jgi:UDP-3-O-[3-hydroxymyristoyl] glucosamine N-acyltransferase